MKDLNSQVSCSYICDELPFSGQDFDVVLTVHGSRLSATPAHAVILSILGHEMADMLSDDEVDLIIFPEGSEGEVQTLVNYLYKGIKGLISQSLAQALGLDKPVQKKEISVQEPRTKVYLKPDFEMKSSSVEPEVKTEVLEDKTVSFKSDVEDDHTSIPLSKTRTRRKRLKQEELDEMELDDYLCKDAVKGEDYVKTNKEKGKEEALELSELLDTEPHRFRFYNRLHYSGTGKNRRANESEDEYFERIRVYDRFPGLIFDDECTRYVVCVECGFVTKNIPSSHRCERKVDHLKTKPVEVFKRMHFSTHLTKYFKQKADKVECKVCMAVLPSMDEFKVHLKAVHNIEPLLYKYNSLYGDYVCEDCGKRFTTMNLMKQHEITKHGKKELAKFRCETCDLYYVTKTNLETHIQRVHEDYRPHVCEECARSFKVKRHLLAHMSTHTGERQFQCRHCEKRFAKEWTRTQHERLHLGLKPYKCGSCDQRFSQKTSLDCHTKTHHSKPLSAIGSI